MRHRIVVWTGSVALAFGASLAMGSLTMAQNSDAKTEPYPGIAADQILKVKNTADFSNGRLMGCEVGFLIIHPNSLDGNHPVYIEGVFGILHPSKNQTAVLLKMRVSSITRNESGLIGTNPDLPIEAALTNNDALPFNNSQELITKTKSDEMMDFIYSLGPRTILSLVETNTYNRVCGYYRMSNNSISENFEVPISSNENPSEPPNIQTSFSVCTNMLFEEMKMENPGK